MTFCTEMGDRIRVQFPVRDIRYVTSHPGQLSLAILSWVGAMSTSQRAVMHCGWEYCTDKEWLVWVCGWQVKLTDPHVTYALYLSCTIPFLCDSYTVPVMCDSLLSVLMSMSMSMSIVDLYCA